MRRVLFLLLLLFVASFIYAQQNTQIPENYNMPAEGVITGYVFDQQTNKPIEYANIVIYSLKDSSIVSGGITDKNGYFKIEKLSFGKFYVDVLFIGYGKITLNDIVVKPDKKEINLGKIFLTINAEVLSEVEVSENVNNVDYKLDKKVINVNQDILAAGATAVEVLENVPSITTDIDGNVSLRGTDNFLVLVDGRPFPIQGSEALQQIPANTVGSIEVITNPSAKYDPDGVGGIINVILKKERRKGYNGQMSANYGNFNTFGTDFIFNFRFQKINFFIGGSYDNRKRKGEGENRRETYLNPDTTYFLNTFSDNYRKRQHGRFRLGLDYYLDDNNILTFTGQYGLGKHLNGSDSWSGSYYLNTIDDMWGYYYYLTENFMNSNNYYFSGDINYMKKFKKAGHELQAFASYSYNFNNEINYYNEFETDYMRHVIGDTSEYRTTEKGEGDNITAKVDYVLPITENGKFEAGYQLKYRNSDNDLRYQTVAAGEWIDDESQLNPYSFFENVQSGYALFSNYFKKLGYQIGLRTEYTDREFFQKLTEESWTYNKFDFFPSVHLSYQFNNDLQLLASYSRRLNRPRPWQLDPFIEYDDANTVRQGNPLLLPEYSNSYDLSVQKKFGKSFISLEAYARQTINKINWITKIYPENENIFLITFDNVGKDLSIGSELMGNLNLTNWYNLNISGTAYYYEIISGEYDSGNTFSWRTRLNNTFRIKKTGTSIQVGGFYTGPMITAQGNISDFFMVNAGFRQDFLDRKLSVSFNVRNILNTMKHESTNKTAEFYSYSMSKPLQPFFNISVSYKINDFKPRKDKSFENDSNDIIDENI